MTPTTITRADELAKAAEEIIQVLDIALSCGVISHGNEHIKNGPRGKMIAALAAYRAARSTDGACDDTAIVSAAAKYHWLSRFDHLSWVNELLNEVRFNTLNSAVEYAMEYEKRAARAASGSGEKG